MPTHCLPMSDELLTITETAQRLHVSERTLRRALREPELQAKLVAIMRRIGGRDRIVHLVDTSLMGILEAKYSVFWQQADQHALTGTLPDEVARVYQELLEERAARIADLLAALEHERQQSRRHAESTALALGRLADLQTGTRTPPKRPWLWRLLRGWGGRP